MSNLRTSISILALATSLALCVTPKIALADDAPPSANGGAITGVQAIKENTEHRDDIIGKMDKEAAAARANREKNLVKPQTTAHIDTGGQTGFTTTPAAPKPEGPSLIDQCVSGVCSFIKWTTGYTAGKAIVDAVVGEPDEAKEYQRHKEDVRKAVEEKNKSEEQKKTVEQPKTAAPKSELKMVDLKSLDAKSSKSIAIPAPKPDTRLVLPETSKARTLTVPRAVTTTVGHIEVKRPTISVPRPTINIVHPTVNIPHPTIRIPTIVAHR